MHLFLNIFKVRMFFPKNTFYKRLFERCDWISYSQLQQFIKRSLSPNVCNDICQRPMWRGVNPKPLASKDVLYARFNNVSLNREVRKLIITYTNAFLFFFCNISVAFLECFNIIIYM